MHELRERRCAVLVPTSETHASMHHDTHHSLSPASRLSVTHGISRPAHPVDPVVRPATSSMKTTWTAAGAHASVSP